MATTPSVISSLCASVPIETAGEIGVFAVLVPVWQVACTSSGALWSRPVTTAATADGRIDPDQAAWIVSTPPVSAWVTVAQANQSFVAVPQAVEATCQVLPWLSVTVGVCDELCASA